MRTLLPCEKCMDDLLFSFNPATSVEEVAKHGDLQRFLTEHVVVTKCCGCCGCCCCCCCCCYLLEIGGTFFQKGSHTFFLIVSSKQRMEQSSLKPQSFLQGQFICGQDRFFSGLDTQLTLGGNDLSNFERFLYQCVVGKDLGDQTALVGLVGTDKFPRQIHVHGFGFANDACQPLCPTSSWNDPQIDFWLSKLCRLGTDHEIAHHGKFTSATQTISRHGGNDGCFQFGNSLPFGKHVCSITIFELFGFHF
mmetsp:Transcript_11250/g.19866  ORF Transcript_11250/g.19866 Transcript_11250/m.19866 type:complete len:250 (+) Transcript_11250:61-810(+)